MLLEEIDRQVNADGGHAELSGHYHRYSTDFYLLATVVARLVDDPAAARYAQLVAAAGTVLWNGPVGVFEFDAFGEGTRMLAEAIAASQAFSIAGGGDTLAAVDKYGVADGISYISTGGGAFLEFCEGKPLPAVLALQARAAV